MNGRRLVLAIGVVLFVIIVSIIIFSIDWGGSRPARDAINKPVNISDYANTDVRVRMSVRGIINSNQEHEQMQITVGRSTAVAELISGYQGSVVRVQQTPSNQDSYKAFLSALHNSSFTDEKLSQPGLQYDGACPNGQRFTFEFLGGEDLPEPLWATSCSKKEGTFNGNLSGVRSLFNAQIPKAQLDTLTDDSQF